MRTAQAAGEEKAGPLHLLAAFLQQECTARQMMEQLGLDAKAEAAECGRRAKAPLWKPAAAHAAPPAPKKCPALWARPHPACPRGQAGPRVLPGGRDRSCRAHPAAPAKTPLPCGRGGRGQTAVVEGLALRIAEGGPRACAGKSVLSLDIGSLVAGTKYQGDFEQRLHDVLAEVRQAGSAILFLDEVHSIMGAGASEGSVDAASILKPILARGEVQVIGATHARGICQAH